VDAKRTRFAATADKNINIHANKINEQIDQKLYAQQPEYTYSFNDSLQ